MRCCDICQQSWSLAYCGQHRQQRQPRPMLPASARVPCAAPASLDHIYQGLLAALPLSPAHHQALRQRGLADSEIRRRHYGTLPLKGRAALATKMVGLVGGRRLRSRSWLLCGRARRSALVELRRGRRLADSRAHSRRPYCHAQGACRQSGRQSQVHDPQFR
jgi:hypothetical protein